MASGGCAGKIGLGMGMTGIATRGLLVTGAPAVFSVAAEYDDGRIKHALDQGAYIHSAAILVYPLKP